MTQENGTHREWETDEVVNNHIEVLKDNYKITEGGVARIKDKHASGLLNQTDFEDVAVPNLKNGIKPPQQNTRLIAENKRLKTRIESLISAAQNVVAWDVFSIIKENHQPDGYELAADVEHLHITLEETPQQSLSEIQAKAVDDFADSIMDKRVSDDELFCLATVTSMRKYAEQLRQQAQEGE